MNVLHLYKDFFPVLGDRKPYWLAGQEAAGRGRFHLDGHDYIKEDSARGKALLPEFSARDDQYLVFLVAGGGWDNVGLRLWADGEEVMVWRGQHSAQFAWTVYPLAAVADKRLQLELFDDEIDDWSFISLAHVMLARRIRQ